jgi:hypothetical protein
MNPVAKYAIAAAAVVVIAVVGLGVLGATNQSEVGNRSPSPAASPSPSRPTEPRGSLPSRRLPGTRASAAGEYGWQGGAGASAGMHKVIEGSNAREVAALIFEVGEDCLAAGQAQESTPVRIAGFDGVSVEPYDPPVPFGGPDGDEITRAHALAVSDRTLCVFVTWHATTTDDERDAALQVLETLRAEPIGDQEIRITFMLDEGWDTG